jgi:hypothetical protein
VRDDPVFQAERHDAIVAQFPPFAGGSTSHRPP